jgi:hypothetical protein
MIDLHMLVECKFRSQEKIIVLLKDPNSDYLPTTLGGTVNILDNFIPYHLPSDAFEMLERSFEYVYKVIELFDGGAIEKDF